MPEATIKTVDIDGKLYPAGLKGCVVQYGKSKGKLECFGWPGGYPMFYLTRRDSVLCQECAQNELESWLESLVDVGKPNGPDSPGEANWQHEDDIPRTGYTWERDGDDDFLTCDQCGCSIDMSEDR